MIFDNIMKSTKEKKVLILIGGGFLMAIAIIALILMRTIRSIHQANRQVYELRLYLEKKHSRSVNARTAIKQVEAIKDSMAGLEKFLYRRGDELRLITLLEDLSNRHHILQKIIASNLDTPSNHRVSMTLNLTGSYLNILEYLQSLEKADYFISINRLHLSSFVDRNKQNADPQTSLDIEFSLYVAN